MKKLIFIFILLPFIGKTQVYQAGTIFPYYYDIVPDTLMNIIGNNSPTENYYFDVNGDLTNDFRIQAYGAGGLGGGNHSITFTPINSNSYVRFGHTDSTWHNWFSYWMLVPVAKPLQFGDSINSGLSSWVNGGLFLYDNSGSAGSYTNVQDWASTNDLYIGVKYQNLSDTIYGWIRVQCPFASRCYVKDFSISKCVNFPIVTVISSSSVLCSSESATISVTGANSYTWSTGSTTSSIVVTPTSTTAYTVNAFDMYGCSSSSVLTQNVDACIGIKELAVDKMKVYPNPANEILYFTDPENQFQNSEIEITNYLGQMVFKAPYTDEIDVSKLPQGIYTLKIITQGNMSCYSKFLKE